MVPDFKVAGFHFLQDDEDAIGRQFKGTLSYAAPNDKAMAPWAGTGRIEYREIDRKFFDDQFADDRRAPIHVRRWDSRTAKALCMGHKYVDDDVLEVSLMGCEDFKPVG